MATIVKVNPDEPIDVVIRKFNRKVQNDLIFQCVREKEHYTKPARERYLRKKEKIRKKRKKR